MKLIVGLGNPGLQYELTPHNLGFLVVDRIAEEHSVAVNNRLCQALTGRTNIGQEQVVLAKPETFMNLSGIAVVGLIEKFGLVPEIDLTVIHDELDLPFGKVRVHRARSSAGHNGVESIIDAIGTKDFLRIRVGVAPEYSPSNSERYLLSMMGRPQLRALEAIIADAAKAAETIVVSGPVTAMQHFNRKDGVEER